MLRSTATGVHQVYKLRTVNFFLWLSKLAASLKFSAFSQHKSCLVASQMLVLNENPADGYETAK